MAVKILAAWTGPPLDRFLGLVAQTGVSGVAAASDIRSVLQVTEVTSSQVLVSMGLQSARAMLVCERVKDAGERGVLSPCRGRLLGVMRIMWWVLPQGASCNVRCNC